MNCTKCGAELKPNAKFCVKCGTPVAQANNNQNTCPKCGAELKPGAKFCVKCGTKIEAASQAPANNQAPANPNQTMTTVKKRIFWNVQPGELARRVNEAEFEQYDNATGIIVGDGTVVYIRSNGELLTTLDGGSYNFVDKEKLENHVRRSQNQREGGLVGAVKRGFHWVVNAVLGHKKGEKQEKTDNERQASVDAVIRGMNKNSMISLTMRLDKDFELVFGDTHQNTDEYSNFVPMKVRTRLFDLNVGVRAMFHIADFDAFSKYYLTDRNVVSTALIADKITPIIKASVEEALRDAEIDGNMISDIQKQQVIAAIGRNAKDKMYGIELVSVVEITATNDDLERFRTMSRELYLSEKELDYLVRTDDFKNRLNIHVDEQELYDARRIVDKDQKLNEINRDALLNKEEFDKFKEILEMERKIRQARNQEQIDIVENEIANTRMTREYESFKLQRKYEAEAEDFDLERDRKRRIYGTETAVQEQQMKDDYEVSRIHKEQDVQMRGQSMQYDLDKRKADDAVDRLAKIKEMERQQAQMDQQHELDILSKKSEMSPEALMALGAAGLDAAAQAEFAKSFQAKANADKEREFNQKMEQMYAAAQGRDAADKAQWMEMMKAMMAQNASMMQSMAGVKDQQTAEYRQRVDRVEQRLEHSQDSAMNYITKNNINQPQPQQPQQVMMKKCPQCGAAVEYDEMFCGECGFKFE